MPYCLLLLWLLSPWQISPLLSFFFWSYPTPLWSFPMYICHFVWSFGVFLIVIWRIMVIPCLVIAFFGVCFASIGSYFSICSQCTLYLGLCGFFLKLFISFCHLFIRIYCHSPVIFIFILLVWLSVFVLLFSQCTSLCSHFIFQQFWGFCHCIISQCSLFFNVCPFKAFFHLLWFWILFLESLCFCCCQFVSAMTHWDHLASQ